MTEFDECRSLNRLLTFEREDIKYYIEINFAKIETSPCYSFIIDKLEEIKNCIRLFEKVNKNILLNIVKFESLDYFYKSERDNALEFVIDIEEKVAVFTDNLLKSGNLYIANKDYDTSVVNLVVSTVGNRPPYKLNLCENIEKTPILTSDIKDNVEENCRSKLDNEISNKKISVKLDTKFEYACLAKPINAEHHLSLNSQHIACHVMPCLVASKEKSIFPIVFDFKYEITCFKMGFENLKLGLSINFMLDLLSLEHFVELNALNKVNFLKLLPPFKIERFIDLACLDIGQNILSFWNFAYLVYIDSIFKFKPEFSYLGNCSLFLIYYFKIWPFVHFNFDCAINCKNVFNLELKFAFKFIKIAFYIKIFINKLNVVLFKCIFLYWIWCMPVAYVKIDFDCLKTVEIAVPTLSLIEFFNFLCNDTFQPHCRIFKFLKPDFVVLNLIFLGETHLTQMLIKFIKIPEGENG